MRYHPRTLSGPLLRAVSQFPVTVVTGPRQSGKTTLVRHHFADTHRYVSLDDPQVRELATSDPTLFLHRFRPPLVLDEIQYAPSLLHAIKLDVDAHREHRGRHVITGSQLFPFMQGVTESLAGRAAVLTLLPFSLREGAGLPEPEIDPFERIAALEDVDVPEALRGPMDLAERLVTGGFPEPLLDESIDPRTWYAAFVQTYLERDVRALRAVGDLGAFERFLVALAARSASPLNASELGRDIGVSYKTVQAWLSVLRASGQIELLRPYFANLGKRLVKAPRVHFLDTGLLAWLLRVRSAEQLVDGPAAGLIFETAVHAQLHRLFAHRGEPPPIHAWRTSSGHEVDFVVDLGHRLVPVEAKLTATPRRSHARSVERFLDLFGDRAPKGYVVCLCPEPMPLTRRVHAIPLGAL